MNTCPNCGKVAGLHSSILQGCMCQYSMQAPPQRTWVGLTEDEVTICHSLAVLNKKHDSTDPSFTTLLHQQIEAKLKEKNNG